MPAKHTWTFRASLRSRAFGWKWIEPRPPASEGGCLEKIKKAARVDAVTASDHVIGAGESWLTELSTAEIKQLFALRQEAVS